MNWTQILNPSRPGRALLFLYVVALVVRLSLLASTHHSYLISGMAQGELARNLAEGRGFVINFRFWDPLNQKQLAEQRLIDVEEWLESNQPDDKAENLRPFIAYMMPGQGILLSGTYLLFVEYRYIFLQILQAGIDSLGVYLMFWMASTLFSGPVGILSALLFALYIPEARLAVSATRDAWMPISYLAAAACFTVAWKQNNLRYALLGGIAVGLGAYFRSEILLLPLCFAGLALLFRSTRRFVVLTIVLGLLPAILLLAPWTVRNYVVFERFIPTNSGLWMATWQSFGEYDNPVGAVNDDVATLNQIRNEGYDVEYDTPEYDELFRPRVMQAIGEHPGWFLTTVLRRIVSTPFHMHSWGLSYTDHWKHSLEHYKLKDFAFSYWRYFLDDPVRFIVQAGAKGVNALIYFLAVWVMIRQRGAREYWFVAAAPLYNIAVHALIGMQARYILPTNELLLVFSACFIVPRLLQMNPENYLPYRKRTGPPA